MENLIVGCGVGPLSSYGGGRSYNIAVKILVVTGTRPNFIKEYSFSLACKALGVEEIVVHTGQHYDENMSRVFFDELKIDYQDYYNETLKTSPEAETGSIMEFIESVLYREKPKVTVVFGDVTSTLAAAIASAKIGVPVAHVEAGTRCQYLYNP